MTKTNTRELVEALFALGMLHAGFVSMLLIYPKAKKDPHYEEAVSGMLMKMQSICQKIGIKNPCMLPSSNNEAESALKNFFVGAQQLAGSIEKILGEAYAAAFLFASSSQSGSFLSSMIDEQLADSQRQSLLSLGEVIGLDEEQVKQFCQKPEKQLEIAVGRIAEHIGALELLRPRRVFIGHGRSDVWLQRKDLLQERLGLHWDEFNREPPAGLTTAKRLENMLESADFAFIVMTGEDTHGDGSVHARENVIHEAGLFQARLGFHRAILLVEDGCEEFSNVKGLTQIRFPQGNLASKSEDIRRVLEREGMIRNKQLQSDQHLSPTMKSLKGALKGSKATEEGYKKFLEKKYL